MQHLKKPPWVCAIFTWYSTWCSIWRNLLGLCNFYLIKHLKKPLWLLQFLPDATSEETYLACAIFTWCNIWRNLLDLCNFLQSLLLLLVCSLLHTLRHHIPQLHGISTRNDRIAIKKATFFRGLLNFILRMGNKKCFTVINFTVIHK